MLELFYMGGPLFMGILTIIFLVMLVVSVINGIPILNGNLIGEDALRRLGYVKSIGLFALVVGVLGQLIGLYSAFDAIQKAGDISPALIAGGIKISMISTLYGFFIYVISWLVWIGLSLFIKRDAGELN